MSKVSQRAIALARRDALHPATRARASAAICAHLEDLPEIQAAECIFCIVPFRTEVDTRPFLHAMLDKRRVVTVPRVECSRTMMSVRITDL
jgi:5,10-methenyltetrahydrofolate synthetase